MPIIQHQKENSATFHQDSKIIHGHGLGIFSSVYFKQDLQSYVKTGDL